jgi:hypothetical protein
MKSMATSVASSSAQAALKLPSISTNASYLARGALRSGSRGVLWRLTWRWDGQEWPTKDGKRGKLPLL